MLRLAGREDWSVCSRACFDPAVSAAAAVRERERGRREAVTETQMPWNVERVAQGGQPGTAKEAGRALDIVTAHYEQNWSHCLKQERTTWVQQLLHLFKLAAVNATNGGAGQCSFPFRAIIS